MCTRYVDPSPSDCVVLGTVHCVSTCALLVRFGEAFGVVSYWVRGVLVFCRVVCFLFCSVEFWVVAVLEPCFGFLSFGCRFGGSEWVELG